MSNQGCCTCATGGIRRCYQCRLVHHPLLAGPSTAAAIRTALSSLAVTAAVAAADEYPLFSRAVLQGVKIIDITYALPKVRLKHCPHRLQPIHYERVVQSARLPNIQVTQHILQQRAPQHASEPNFHMSSIVQRAALRTYSCQRSRMPKGPMPRSTEPYAPWSIVKQKIVSHAILVMLHQIIQVALSPSREAARLMHLKEQQVAEVHAPGVISQAAAALAEAQVVGEGFTLLRVLLGMEQEPQLAIAPASERMRMK